MENPRLSQLMNSVDLGEVLAKPTEERPEFQAAKSIIEPMVSAAGDFHIVEEPVIQHGSVPAAPPQPIEPPYDPVRNAKGLVYGLQAIESIVLTPIAIVKTRKSAGGKEVLDKMKAAYIKKMSGKKLTEEEENQVKALEDFERKMKLLSDDFLPSPGETQKLIEAAIPYCEETKLEVKSGLAFWGAFAGSLVNKVTKIAMS